MMEPESASPILRRYYDLRQYLGIDLLELDKAFNETPKMFQQAGELAADADANENAAKHALDVIRAEAGERIRSVAIHGKDPSEARIASLLPLDGDVQEARTALDNTRYESQVCTALYKSLEVQSRLLSKASDMVLSSYMSPSVVLDQRRAEIRKARIEAEAERLEAEAERRETTEKAPHVGRPVD
jgi:hypothetical protein